MAPILKIGITALVAGYVAAAPSNMHARFHRHAKRDLVTKVDYDIVTDVVIQTVTEGASAPAEPTAAVSAMAVSQPIAAKEALHPLDAITNIYDAPAATAAPAAPVAVPAPSAAGPAPLPAAPFNNPFAAASSAIGALPNVPSQAPAPAATTLATFVSSAPPASSAAPAPSSPSTPDTSSGSKRGVAYNNAQYCNLFSGSGFSWAYNWGYNSDGLSSNNLNYVPMLWSDAPEKTSGWDSAVKSTLSSGGKYLLGFNEPDNAGQANMSPQQAAQSWKTYMQKYAGQAKLVSPAITNSETAGQGISWMQQFLSACSDCQIDAIAVHWYAPASSGDYFQNFIKRAHDQFQKPIWITEFQAEGSSSEQEQWMNKNLPWLEQQDYVQRYAYFMAKQGSLIAAAGNALSSIGRMFAKNF